MSQPNLPRKIRVLVAEDEESLRQALGELIEGDPDLELVALAGDADEAIAMAIQYRPHVCLTDVKMPGGGGPRVAQEVRRQAPWVKIIALTAYEDRGTVTEMLRAGAVGYLVKGGEVKEILNAIHRTAHGESILSAEVTSTVLKELSPRLQKEAQETRETRERIGRVRSVIDEGRIHTVYQPILDLRSRGLLGAEALSRVDHRPTRPPDVWLDEADSVGLLESFEIAAINKAITGLELLPDGALLFLNVSPRTLISTPLTALIDAKVLPRCVIEITEHTPVQDYDAVLVALANLRESGARVAVDDAGAGFASLSHILKIDPDFIKLDVSLTRTIDSDIKKQALAGGLVAFGSKIGLTLTAEGIENEAELEILKELGVTYGQGYYLARPGPAADIGKETT